MAMLQGCASNGDVIKNKPIIDPSCQWVDAIYISKDDSLTAGTARQILDHNEKWEFNCNLLP